MADYYPINTSEPQEVTSRAKTEALEARVAILEVDEDARGFDYIAVGEGRNDAAVQAAMDVVKANWDGGLSRKGLYFPPGGTPYYLSQPLVPDDPDNHVIRHGLRIKGHAPRSTTVVWDGADQPFISATRMFRFFSVSDMSFKSGSSASSPSGNRFINAFSDASGGFNNRWNFDRLEFGGRWYRVFGLDGDADANLNSEMAWTDCDTDTSFYADRAFLEIGMDPLFGQEHQFLNYTLDRCNLTTLGTGPGGAMLLVNKGGSIHVRGGSWSGLKPSSGPFQGGTDTVWISMPHPSSNTRSASHIRLERVRFEPKIPVDPAKRHVVMSNKWGRGRVSFVDCCDLSSIQNPGSHDLTLYEFTAQYWQGGHNLPAVKFEGHQGAGGVHVDMPTTAGLPRESGGFRFEQAYYYRGDLNEPAVATQEQGSDSPVLTWTGGDGNRPWYRFLDCDNVPNITDI